MYIRKFTKMFSLFYKLVYAASELNVYHWVFDNIQEIYDIGTSTKIFQNLDFTFNFLFLYWLQRSKKIKQSFSCEVRSCWLSTEIARHSRYRCCITFYISQTFKIFTTTFSSFVMFMASNTSLYLPRPNFRTSS